MAMMVAPSGGGGSGGGDDPLPLLDGHPAADFDDEEARSKPPRAACRQGPRALTPLAGPRRRRSLGPGWPRRDVLVCCDELCVLW